MSAKSTEAMLEDFRQRLPQGRARAVPGSVLAADLGVSERTIRALTGDLIDRGVLVGSHQGGYFLVVDREDLESGTRHLVSRARAMFARVSRLRRTAEQRFGQDALTLFDLESV